MVERNLAKVEVESSRLFSRSIYMTHGQHEGQYSTVLPFFVGAAIYVDADADADVGSSACRWWLHSAWLMARLSAWLLPPWLNGWMCSSVAASGNTCSPHTQQGTTPCN